MLLQYDFSVVGVQAVHSALAGIERRMVQHNRTVARTLGQGMNVGGRTSSATGITRIGGGRAMSETARGFDQIGRAARAAELRLGRERLSQERSIERARIAGIERAHRIEAAKREAFRRNVIGTGSKSVRGTVGAIAGYGGAALGLGAGFAVMNALDERRKLKRSAAGLANQAYGLAKDPKTGKLLSREELAAGVESVARTTATTTGRSGEEVISGLREFQAISGKLDVGLKMVPFLTKIADATDADFTDVGKTAGQIVAYKASRGTDMSTAKGQAEAMKSVEEIMLTIGGQAKTGSIEFRDMAQQMGKLLSTAGDFSGTLEDNVRVLGAVAQLSMTAGPASAEEALTSLMRLRDDMMQKGPTEWKKRGIDVFERDKAGNRTALKSPQQVLVDAIEKTKGDIPKAMALVGIRGNKMTAALRQASAAAGGGEKGLDVVRQMLGVKKGPAGEIYNSKMTKKELSESAAFKAKSMQLEIATEQLKDALGTELYPVLTQLVPEFAKLIPQVAAAARGVASFTKWVVDHPALGIGGIIAGKLAADIAGAAIGNAVKEAIVKGIGGGGAGQGLFGAAGVGLTVGTITAAGITVAGIKGFESAEKQADAGLWTLKTVQGMSSPKARADAAAQALPGERKRLDKLENVGWWGKAVENVGYAGMLAGGGLAGGLLMSQFGGMGQETVKSATKTQQTTVAKLEQIAGLAELNEAAKGAAGELKKISGDTPNRGASPSPVK